MAMQRTFSIIKPDATERNLTGKINAIFEDAGLRIVAQKRIHMSLAQAQKFYEVHSERPFFGELTEFMSRSPVVVQVLEALSAGPGGEMAHTPHISLPGPVVFPYANTRADRILSQWLETMTALGHSQPTWSMFDSIRYVSCGRSSMVNRLIRRAASAVCALACLSALPAHAAIWEATSEWTEEHERTYAEWVREEFDKDFFHQPEETTIFGLALDCSDAIYAMRIMYAYENSLPFAINDPTGKRRTLSNEFTKWDGYRETRREELPADVPGASLEQWEIAANLGGSREAFALATQEALASVKEPLGQKASRLFASLCDYAAQRVDIVNHGLNYLARMEENHGRQCMGIGEYAEYSTPGRDKKLDGQFRVLGALRSDPAWGESSFAEKEAIEAIFDPENTLTEEEVGAFCAVPFDIGGGRNMTLRELYRGLEAGRLVSDPHAPLEYRWGLARDGWSPQCKSAMRS